MVGVGLLNYPQCIVEFLLSDRRLGLTINFED